MVTLLVVCLIYLFGASMSSLIEDGAEFFIIVHAVAVLGVIVSVAVLVIRGAR